MDIYLLAKCKFFIVSATGLAMIPRLFRKPQVFVNLIPLQMDSLLSLSQNSLIIPKKLLLRKENRFLTFKEMFELYLDIHYKGNYYEDNNIEPVENTPEEILDVVIEMDDRQNDTWQTQKADEELQDIFWSFLPSDVLKNKYRLRIGTEFLRKNKDLLKC